MHWNNQYTQVKVAGRIQKTDETREKIRNSGQRINDWQSGEEEKSISQFPSKGSSQTSPLEFQAILFTSSTPYYPQDPLSLLHCLSGSSFALSWVLDRHGNTIAFWKLHLQAVIIAPNQVVRRRKNWQIPVPKCQRYGASFNIFALWERLQWTQIMKYCVNADMCQTLHS